MTITANMTNRDILLQEVENLKAALDRFTGLLPEDRPAGYYRSLFMTLERHGRELAGLVEIVDTRR